MNVNNADILSTDYTFVDGVAENFTTLLVNSITNAGNGWSSALSYTYDSRGNIEIISENGTQKAKYYYDDLNQLVREDNAWLGKTIAYNYDNGGNILNVKEYTLTSASDISALVASSTDTYAYTDSNWKDKLTSYNGNAITYDEIGNPLTYYNGLNFDWQNGRQLASVSSADLSISYKYDSSGIRTEKTVNGVTTTYILEGSNIVKETNGIDTIWYYYDATDSLTGFELNGTPYFYVSNVQGDIVAITDASGNIVVEYAYDSWGKPISVTGSLASTVGVKNPFRYRGYYYDTETGLYYLNSRYYDSCVKRFINADSITDGCSGIIGNNLFIYSANNPINSVDPSGKSIIKNIKRFVKKYDVKTLLNKGKKLIKKGFKKAKPYVKSLQSKLKNKNFTISIGQKATTSYLSMLGFGGQIAFDSKGNVTGLYSVSFGVSSSPVATCTTVIEGTNAPSTKYLEGISNSGGLSYAHTQPYMPTFLWGGGVSSFTSQNKRYYGLNTFSGISTPDQGLGGSLEVTYTESLWSFNIFDDFLEPTYDAVMEW